MRTMKHLTLAVAAAAALALAGCGGGGGGTSSIAPTAPTTPPEPPAPAPVATVMIPDAMYLNDDNMPAAMTHDIAAGDSATNNGVMFSCPAGGDACEVEVMADGSVTSTGGEAMAALTDDAVLQVAQAKKAAADAAMAAAQENKDRVIGKDRALERAAGFATDGTAGSLDENDIGITRAAGAMARVRVSDITGYSVSDDAALPNGDWAGTHLTRSITGATQHLFVYTDIEAPDRIQFYNFDNKATTRSHYDTAAYHDGTAPVTTSDTTDYENAMPALPLAGRFSATTADLSQFPAPQSPEEGSLTKRYPNNEDTDNDPATLEQYSTPGNYNGAGGRYTCTGGTTAAPCAVTVAPDGSYDLVGTWNFVPELNATAWLQDQEFMSFGWWLQEPTAQTGVYTFRYYADGTAYQLAAGDLSSGSATYNGRAAGKFVMQELDDTGVTGGMAGQFTAAASLTAKFSGAAAGGTLEGMISGFATDNADVDVSGWSVALNKQTITGATGANVTSTGANDDPTASGFDGATATLGEQTLHGDWDSQFFGLPSTADAYPLGVGGTFQADNEQASIAGAFGARR